MLWGLKGEAAGCRGGEGGVLEVIYWIEVVSSAALLGLFVTVNVLRSW